MNKIPLISEKDVIPKELEKELEEYKKGITIDNVNLKIKPSEEATGCRDIRIKGNIEIDLTICVSTEDIVKSTAYILIPDKILQEISNDLGIQIKRERGFDAVIIDENILLST